jgi:tRNA(Ile)-lysidine synthase TilS/MesJ
VIAVIIQIYLFKEKSINMFITKKRLAKMVEDAKNEAVNKERERQSLREELNDLHRYIFEVDERVTKLEGKPVNS